MTMLVIAAWPIDQLITSDFHFMWVIPMMILHILLILSTIYAL